MNPTFARLVHRAAAAPPPDPGPWPSAKCRFGRHSSPDPLLSGCSGGTTRYTGRDDAMRAHTTWCTCECHQVTRTGAAAREVA